jgi:transposase
LSGGVVRAAAAVLPAGALAAKAMRLAEGICEAVTRPTMRFVAAKGPEQQAVLMLHRTRDLLVRS